MADDDKIEALQREIEALKRAMAPTAADRAESERRVAEHRDRMHQMAEARMAHAAPFTRADLAAFEAAAPRSVCQDIAARGGIPGPSTAGAGGTISAVRGPSGVYPNTGGWRPETPFGPQPGINHVDRLVDAQDAKDRAELIAEHARMAAMKKAIAEAK
jgi:hypothetical protein